ncbi:hypothetical protein AgCh_031995 [Apium graveolens]
MAKTAAMRSALTQFAQQPTESKCEAWERYKKMLRKCPHHGMPDWMVITGFYNGLGAQSRPMLDAAAGGALMMPGKVAGILEVEAATAIATQLQALSMKVDSLATYGVNQIAMICELCAGSHATDQCSLANESVRCVVDLTPDVPKKQKTQGVPFESGSLALKHLGPFASVYVSDEELKVVNKKCQDQDAEIAELKEIVEYREDQQNNGLEDPEVADDAPRDDDAQADIGATQGALSDIA